MLYVPLDKVLMGLDVIIDKIRSDFCVGDDDVAVDPSSLCEALHKLQLVLTKYAQDDMDFCNEIFRH